MKKPGFMTVDSAPLTPDEGKRDRLLMRQNRTQPANVLGRFVLASGTISIVAADWQPSGVAYLDRIASKDGDAFANPGYLPALLCYMLNTNSQRTASALTPLPFYDLTVTSGVVATWYDAKVINDGSLGGSLKVRVTVRSIDDTADHLFYWYALDGPPDGLLST